MPRKNFTTQLVALEEVRSHPYFRNFEPRAYPSYEERKLNPVAYLEEVGIEKVGEFVQFGFTSIQIAAALGVSTFVLRKWITNNPEYGKELEIAKSFAAEEYVQQADDELKQASDAFELSKASERAKHRRWRAERIDKDQFGSTQNKDRGITDNAFIFNFNMPLPDMSKTTVIQTATKAMQQLPSPLNMKDLFAEADVSE